MRVALAAVLLMLASPLVAQTAAQAIDDGQALFRRLDADRDGYLSARELAAPAAAQGNWIAVDRNRDGRIGRDEFGVVRHLAGAPRSGAAGGTQPRPSKGEARP